MHLVAVCLVLEEAGKNGGHNESRNHGPGVPAVLVVELVRELHDLSPQSVGVPHLLGGGAAGHKHPHGSWGHHLAKELVR